MGYFSWKQFLNAFNLLEKLFLQVKENSVSKSPRSVSIQLKKGSINLFSSLFIEAPLYRHKEQDRISGGEDGKQKENTWKSR